MFLDILKPISLIIWLPGLLFMLAILYTLLPGRRESDSKRMHQAALGLFVLSLIIAFVVPMNEIRKAVTFADAITEEPVTSFADISYTAREAYKSTALPVDERPELTAAGGDMFDFSQSEAGAAGDAADQASEVISEISYAPEYGLSWFMLVTFMIAGLVFFVQGPMVMSRNAWSGQPQYR